MNYVPNGQCIYCMSENRGTMPADMAVMLKILICGKWGLLKGLFLVFCLEYGF